MVARVENRVAAWLALGDHATGDDTGFVYVSWLEAAANRKQLRRFCTETLAWIAAHQDVDNCDFVIESWLDKNLEFDRVAEASFRAVRRLYDKASGTFILKHVVRQSELPEDVIFAALCWCARFPGHADALNRLGPLVTIDRANKVGAAKLTSVVAKVLYHQDIGAVICNRFRLVAARATLGELFKIGEIFPRIEKLARIYFIRWLRDGRVFRPTLQFAQAGETLPRFDQKLSLAQALLTVMTYGEFAPATNYDDETALAQFCDWVGQWKAPDRNAIAGLIEELTDRFGLRHLWQRMLPGGQIPLDNAPDQSA